MVCWDRLPKGDLAAEAVPAIVPDFVVEVISKGNTRAEMRPKLEDYFTAGVRLVWYIDRAPHCTRSQVKSNLSKWMSTARYRAVTSCRA